MEIKDMFGKHFASTYTGSMIGSGPLTFAVWPYVTAHTESDGFVELNPQLIAFTIGDCTAAQIEAVIERFCSPDSKSRSKEEEGRRLVREGEFLYRVVNFAKYRAMRDDSSRKEYRRNWMKAKRQEARERSVNTVNTSEPKQKQKQKQSTEEEGKRTVRSQEVSRPSLEEVLAKAQFIGLAEWKAKDWFEEMECCGWIDYLHRPVVNWTSMLTRLCRKWEADGRPASPPAYRKNGSSSVMDLKTIIATKEKLATDLKNRHCLETGLGDDWSNDDARLKYKVLSREIHQLTTQLAAMA